MPYRFVVILILALFPPLIGAKNKEETSTNKGFSQSAKNVYVPQIPYFMLPQFSVAIIRDGDVIGYFNFVVELRASGIPEYEKASKLIPEIVDGIVTDLYIYLPLLWITKAQPSTDSIKLRMWAIINKLCGEGTISHIVLHRYLWVPQEK